MDEIKYFKKRSLHRLIKNLLICLGELLLFAFILLFFSDLVSSGSISQSYYWITYVLFIIFLPFIMFQLIRLIRCVKEYYVVSQLQKVSDSIEIAKHLYEDNEED